MQKVILVSSCDMSKQYNILSTTKSNRRLFKILTSLSANLEYILVSFTNWRVRAFWYKFKRRSPTVVSDPDGYDKYIFAIQSGEYRQDMFRARGRA